MKLEDSLEIVLSGNKISPLSEMVLYWNKAGIPLKEEDLRELFPEDVEVSELTPDEKEAIRAVFQELAHSGITDEDIGVIRRILSRTIDADRETIEDLTQHIASLLPSYREMTDEPEEKDYDPDAGLSLYSRLQDMPSIPFQS